MSIKSFEEFNIGRDILKALAWMKYEIPTEVQSVVIPKALENHDLIVKSQTGSGKTASFGIPVCEMIEWEGRNPQALILTPTRELAVQIREEVMDIGRYKRVKAIAVYGKESFEKQADELEQKMHIVVGTPGRVIDHIEKGTLHIEDINYLIIDEADEMLNRGFVKDVEAIINKLPVSKITMVFSATLPKKIDNLCQQFMNNPQMIQIASEEKTATAIEHCVIKVKEAEKMALLKTITVVENPDSCIIFCKTKGQVDKVFTELAQSNYSVEKIHGGMIQEDRFAVMEGFKMGNFRYLVATDVAARGIDVDNISLVINYDIPMEKESYVHRTGRTGRAGKKGKAILFVTPNDTGLLKGIERYIGFEMHVYNAPSQKEVTAGRKGFEKKSSGRLH